MNNISNETLRNDKLNYLIHNNKPHTPKQQMKMTRMKRMKWKRRRQIVRLVRMMRRMMRLMMKMMKRAVMMRVPSATKVVNSFYVTSEDARERTMLRVPTCKRFHKAVGSVPFTLAVSAEYH